MAPSESTTSMFCAHGRSQLSMPAEPSSFSHDDEQAFLSRTRRIVAGSGVSFTDNAISAGTSVAGVDLVSFNDRSLAT